MPPAVRFPRRASRDIGASPSQLDRDVLQLLRWLKEGPQVRGILAQRMHLTDRRMRRTIEEARARGELVIWSDGLYRIASGRPEYEAWREHEVMSRMGRFGLQMRAMNARADRQWPAEQLRLSV